MQTRFKAHNQYANVAASTRTEGADPHRLVALLFEECLTCLKRVELSLMNGAGDLAGTAASKARAILDALSGSLDFEQGGRIADDLAAIYDYCKARITHALKHRDAAAALEAHGIMSEIAGGWEAIGERK